MDGAQDAEDVGLELAPVVLEPETIHAADDAEAGVRHHDVDPPQGLHGDRRRALHVAVHGDVAGDGERAPAPRLDLRRERPEPVETPRGEHNVGAPTRELARERRTDARRRPRDQDHLAREGHGVRALAVVGLLMNGRGERI